MTTKTTRRTKIKAGIILTAALIFLSVLTILSFSFVGDPTAQAATDYDSDDYHWIEITNGFIEQFKAMTGTNKDGWAPGVFDKTDVVDTIQEFIYVFHFNEEGSEYTLGANFKIVSMEEDGGELIESKWSRYLPKIKNDVVIDGAGYTIWNAAAVIDASTSGAVVGGLVSENKGTIQNLNYYFSGNLYANLSNMKDATSEEVPEATRVKGVRTGGMIGYNAGSGELINCRIEIGGEIITETDVASANSYVGGAIGYNEGNITDCTIISSVSLQAFSDMEGGGNTAHNNNIYAGGVIGAMVGGTMSGTQIKTSANIMSADQIKTWEGESNVVSDAVNAITGAFGVSLEDYGLSLNETRNENEVHPASCVIGCLSGASKMLNNDLDISGSALSYGFAGSGAEGSISGGMIGLIDEYVTSAAVRNNNVTLKCSLSGFWVYSFNPLEEVKGFFSKLIGSSSGKTVTNVYSGAFVGKMKEKANSDGTIAVENNFIYIDKDSGIIEDGADYDNGTYTCHTGLLCGNEELVNYLGSNNWLARKLAECSTGRIAGDDIGGSTINHLCVFGDGNVKGRVMESGAIEVTATPEKSPFYGYTADITTPSPSWITTKKTTLAGSTGGIRFAVFIDTEINSSGELTQLAKDINLIKKPVWREIKTANQDHRFYNTSVSSYTTLSWLRVTLGKDILVSQGTPVIEDFYGTFNGNGHTISFGGGSVIKHDYEAEDRSVLATGLFGTIMEGGIVSDLNILFGGSMSETDGLSYKRYTYEDEDGKEKSASDALKALRYVNTYNDEIPLVSTRVIEAANIASFDLPSDLTGDKCYLYFLQGSGYSAEANRNPGYVEVVPYYVEVETDKHYIGILAGRNVGTISNVNVEGTKGASVKCTANNVYFGTLCGCNEGSVENAEATMRGRATLKGREATYAGGMFGINAPKANSSFSGLNAYVSGEIKMECALNYFIATWYSYDSVITRKSDGSSLPEEVDGHEIFAYDYIPNSNGPMTIDYGVYLKNRRAILTERRDCGDDAVVKQAAGAFIGYQASTNNSFTTAVGVAGYKGSFNSFVLQTDPVEENQNNVEGYIGAMIGYADSIPHFSNAWAVMSSKEFDESAIGASGRKVIGNAPDYASDRSTGVNLVYVEETVTVASLDMDSTTPVTFSLEAKEGFTFSGWYNYTSGERVVVHEGLEGSTFTPQDQSSGGRIYKVELVNLLITKYDELKKISASTNEGRGYLDVEFTLGNTMTLDSGFAPIGTPEYPFLGTLDGNGLTIIVDSLNASKLAGLFGCIGEQGTVKNITVSVKKNIGSNTFDAAGAIAAINYGTIGQDRSTGKVYAEIDAQIVAKNVGGIVGVNYGTVMNAEVRFLAGGNVSANATDESMMCYGGGAIGLNESNALSEAEVVATAMNLIVSYREGGSAAVFSNMNYCALGGVIGFNAESANAYSVVSVVNAGDVVGGMYGSPGVAAGQDVSLGLIIGKNESSTVSALWCLYLAAQKNDPTSPANSFGDPVKVYRGESGTPTVTEGDRVVLLNGENHLLGNILIQYGYGTVSVSIAASHDGTAGGQINFLSKGSDEMTFYDYVASFESGEVVPVTEGNIGYAFAPTNDLTSKVYYAGFANSTIASQSDYNDLATVVNGNYKLYVRYNVSASFALNADTPHAIGENSPFCGSINGNGYTVTLAAGVTHAFVGTLGAADNRYSEIKNLRFSVQPGVLIEETSDDDGLKRGFLTDVNNGQISSLILTVRGTLLNPNGYCGSVAGENNGVIVSTTFLFEYGNYLGSSGFGFLYGRKVGGLVGINNGVIGSSSTNAIDVTFEKGGAFGGVLYGEYAAGAIVGVNGATGEIFSIIANLSGGTLVGDYASALAAINEGSIHDSFLYVDTGFTYAAKSAFGAVAAKNVGVVGTRSAGSYRDDVRAFLYASPYQGAGFTFYQTTQKTVATGVLTVPETMGGAVGTNEKRDHSETGEGVLNGVLVELHASVIASLHAGGAVGENAGLIRNVRLTSVLGANVIGKYSGGVTAKNRGRILFVNAILHGDVGSAVEDADKGIVTATKAGGFAAEIYYTGTVEYGDGTIYIGGSIENSVVTLYGALRCGTYDAVAHAVVSINEGEHVDPSILPEDVEVTYAPLSGITFGINAWVQVSNASAAPVGTRTDAGFNVLHVLNDTLLTPTFDYVYSTVTFESVTEVTNWYTDISGWEGYSWEPNTSGYLTGAEINGPKLTPDVNDRNKDYYVCYDELTVMNPNDIVRVAALVNSHDYFRGVLFRLTSDINVGAKTILTPIGTEEHPFNGIFDGNFKKITFSEKSGISGAKYAGLFGYTTENSLIKNFVLQINKGVYIGSVSSYEIGAVVGHSEGTIENVFASLSSNLVYHSGVKRVGAFAGYAGALSEVTNSWISVLNDAAKNVVGENDSAIFLPNAIGVLGNGLTEVLFDEKSEEYATAKYYVPTGKGIDFEAFGGWFSDIRTGERMDDEATFIKEYSADAAAEEIYLIPNAGCANKRVTLSFIELEIEDGAGFVRFANNVNTYGDQGALFTLKKNITLNYAECLSVGSADHPFTGHFNGNGKTVTVVETLAEGRSRMKRDYAGLFGYVGENGIVENLSVEAGAVRFGDSSTLYSGIAVGLLYGEIKNVVVRASAETVVYTTQGTASLGGIVGRAGKLGETAEETHSYRIDNCWLILEEGATVSGPVGEDDYYLTNRKYYGYGRVMRIVGEGTLGVEITNDSVLFDASRGSAFYGFIDDNNQTDDTVETTHDGSNVRKWTVMSGVGYVKATGVFDAEEVYYTEDGVRVEEPQAEDFDEYYLPALLDKDGDPASTSMLSVFVNTAIRSEEDLARVAENVRLGRNFRGITYTLYDDIDITGAYTPIGGVVTAEDGSYVECEFLGELNGNGNTVTFKESAVIDARYAGLFGKLGSSARIRDLTVVADGRIGVDTGDNTTRTLYAGVLAGYAEGGSFSGVLTVTGRLATLYGSVSVGRTFGFLTRDSETVATNCWAISYNSKAIRALNDDEAVYNSALASAPSEVPEYGANQGGVNTIMVVAAGIVAAGRNNDGSFSFAYSSSYAQDENFTVYRYDMADPDTNIAAENEIRFSPDKSLSRKGYIVSFLKNEIANATDLINLATAVNDGYDFYGITFEMTADIEITADSGFEAIGNERSGMNGTFDGQGHTVTLASGARIEGRYAGVFGAIASEGTVKNLRILLRGTLGRNDVDESVQTGSGKVNTLYAGAIAYNAGHVTNVVCVADGVKLLALNGKSGLVIGYDDTNLVSNVWALVDASSYVPTIGEAKGGDSGVNTMKIIGKGVVDAEIHSAVKMVNGDPVNTYEIRFYNVTTEIPVLGWYRSFEKNYQLSDAMIAGLKNGADGELTAPADSFGVQYEVAVIKTAITEIDDIVALARDVNVGGYTFETVTFNLENDIEFNATGFVSIGTEERPFKGTFLGKGHTLTYKAKSDNSSIGGIFGNNAGVIRDLRLVVEGIVGETKSDSDRIYGALVAINKGTIESVSVEIAATGRIVGYTIGGIAGDNEGRIADCIVVVRGEINASSSMGRNVNAGGVAGVNYGVIEGTRDFSVWQGKGVLPTDLRDGVSYEMEGNLFLFGKITATGSTASDIANAGGVVGNNAAGSTLHFFHAYVMEGENAGLVKASARADESARAGGLVGYARSSINHSVVFVLGSVEATVDEGGSALAGGAAGYLHGVTAMDVWQVTRVSSTKASAKGSKSINTLIVKGSGKIRAKVDFTMESILFSDITDQDGAEINGWYLASSYKRADSDVEEWKASVAVDSRTGNVGEGGSNFLPRSGLLNKTVIVLFVNTAITSVEDLMDMADSVSAGLMGKNIVFTLEADLTLDANTLTRTIGSRDCPFNDVFDGQGHTITFRAGAFDALLGKEGEIALFGYNGTTGVVRDLILVVEGGASEEETVVYGGDGVERMAILVAYAEGSIKNVTLTVQENAEIKGRIAAGLVASFLSDDKSVEGVTLVLDGKITAVTSSEPNLIAAGLIGMNNGILSNATVTVGEKGEVRAIDAPTVYVGIVVGENYKKIETVSVAFEGNLIAKGRMTAYGGVVAGLNLGTIERAYVEWGENAGFGEADRSYAETLTGGLIGNNINTIKDSLIKVTGVDFPGTDSAVAFTKAAANRISNVWVYTDRTANFSANPSVNCITCDAENGFTLSCPDKASVLKGKIAFLGELPDDIGGIALFARVKNGASVAGTGAAILNVEYTAGGDIRYVAYDAVNEDTENEVVTTRAIYGNKLVLLARTEIGSGEEFVAFGQAVNSGFYDLDGTTFTLTADFALPTAAELPAGSFVAIDLPSGVTLNGGHHVVTIGDAPVTAGIFSSNAGRIEKIGLRLTKAETAASLVLSNDGVIENAVVYLERGASLSTKAYFSASGTGSESNCRLVVREYDAEAFASVAYPVIKINGAGDLVQGGDELTFTAVAGEDAIFVGYSASDAIFSTEDAFVASENLGNYYTAEFLSLKVGSFDDLGAIAAAAALGYTGEGETFTLTADILMPEALFGDEVTFLGRIDGAGHTVTAGDTVAAALLGAFGGEIDCVHFDLTALTGEIALFSEGGTVTMKHVVITEEREAVFFGATLSAASSDVWVDTGRAELYDDFSASGYSLLYRTGELSYHVTAEKITAVATDSEEKIFAGWYGDAVVTTKSFDLPLAAGKKVMLNCMDRTITSGADLKLLAKAVKNGFDFAGVTFTVAGGEIVVTEKIDTIGDAAHPFKGTLKGTLLDKDNRASSKITFKSAEAAPFLYKPEGEISDIFFSVEGNYAAGEAFIMDHAGSLKSVVLQLKNAENTCFLAGGNGTLNNCWIISENDCTATVTGVNQIYATSGAVVKVEMYGDRVVFDFDRDVGTFLSLYEFKEDGAAIDPPENFDTDSMRYISPVSYEYALGGARVREDVRFTVRGISEIRNEREFLYLLYQANANKLFATESATLEVKIVEDILFRSNYDVKLFADRLIFDLQGHTLTLAEPLFDKRTTGGTIKNGSIRLKRSGVGTAGLTLANVTLFLESEGITLASYDLEGEVTIVTPYKRTQSAASGSYLYLYIPEGAEMQAVYTEASEDVWTVEYLGADNDDFYFVQIADDELHANVREGLYAPTTIRTTADYEAFVRANNQDPDRLVNKTVRLDADLSFAVSSRVLLEGFKGIFDAQGKTVTLTGGTLESSFIDATADENATGRIVDLRLVLKNVTIAEDVKVIDLREGSVGRIALVYHVKNNVVHTLSDAKIVNVYGEQGEIEVTFGEKMIFTATGTDGYSLRKWTDADDLLIGEDKRPELTLEERDEKVLKAFFDVVYRVTVVAPNGQGTLPTFTGTGRYFTEDLKDGEGHDVKIAITASYDDVTSAIASGTVFFKLTLAADSDEASLEQGATPLTYNITWVEGQYDIRLTADVEYVNIPWIEKTYDGTLLDYEEALIGEAKSRFDAVKTRATGALYELEITYDRLGGAPALVDGKPYHAGEYRVNLTYKKGDLVMGAASCGLVIRKAPLSVTPIVASKTYDGTVDATFSVATAEGWIGGDEAYVEILLDGTFIFENADAGEHKTVLVNIDELGLAAKSLPASEKDRYVYLDYEVTLADICTATIRRREISVNVPSYSVDYLSQFDEDFILFDDAFLNTVKDTIKSDLGFLEADVEPFKDAITAALFKAEKTGRTVSFRVWEGESYETVDFKILGVDYYRILLNAAALNEINEVFRNYRITLTGDPYLYVSESTVTFFFEDSTCVYGADFTPTYYFKADGKTYRQGSTYEMADGVIYLPLSEMPLIEAGAFDPALTPKKEGGEYVASSYSFSYLFLRANKNYRVDYTEFKSVNGYALPLLSGTVNVTVTPKPVTVVADGNAKVFGAADGKLQGRLVGTATLAAGHTLVVGRTAGEDVGTYPLTYAVRDAEGKDVSDYYLIGEKDASGYTFEITKRILTIRLNKKTVTYGTLNSVAAADLESMSVKGLSLLELHRKLGGKKTSEGALKLSDLGVNLSYRYGGEALVAGGYFPVGEHDLTGVWAFSGDAIGIKASNNIDVVLIDGKNEINVIPLTITVTLRALANKTYSGKNEFKSSDVKYAALSGDITKLLNGENLELVGEYYLTSGGVNVGVYTVDASFRLIYKSGARKGEEETENYKIQVIRSTYTVVPKTVSVNAELGYFDEDGTFTAVPSVYYGDSKADLCFTCSALKSIISLDGTDKEVSDRIVSELRITYQKLARYLPGDTVNPVATNGNYDATITCNAMIDEVELTIRISAGEKTAGDPDPELKWELVAKDAVTGEVIEDYLELTEGTFDISVTADREDGESSGSYKYANVKVNIVNKALGASLMDELTETGRAFSESIEIEGSEDLELVIKSDAFTSNKKVEYLVYGLAIAGVAIIVVFLLIILPIILKKSKAKKTRRAEEAKNAEENARREGDLAASKAESDQPTDEEIARQLDATEEDDKK